MGYIKFNETTHCKVGDTVILLSEVSSMMGKFEEGSIVKIIGEDMMRGFDYEDELGNRVLEAGRNCKVIENGLKNEQ